MPRPESEFQMLFLSNKIQGDAENRISLALRKTNQISMYTHHIQEALLDCDVKSTVYATLYHREHIPIDLLKLKNLSTSKGFVKIYAS